MFSSKELLSRKLPDVRVAIGRGTDVGNVERSVQSMGSHNVVIYDDPYELTDDLVSGNVEAAIRGDMSSSHLLPILKEKVGLSELERVAFMEPIGGRMFILAPVGIDEGWSNEQRINLAVKSAVLARRVGMGEKIAIMSGGPQLCQPCLRTQKAPRRSQPHAISVSPPASPSSPPPGQRSLP